MRRSIVTTRPLAAILVAGCLACTAKEAPRPDSTGAVATGATATAATAAAPAAADHAAATTEATVPPPVGRDTAVEYYTAAILAHVGDSLARGATTGHALRTHPTFQYLQIRRNRSGVPEVHDRWIDVTIVQAGRATLLSGGRVHGSHVESAGEHRGGSIAGATSRPVGPGDLMIIPAGIPHQYMISPGDSLRYLTVKVLRPDAGR